MKKFCDIQSRNELADYLGIPRSKLYPIKWTLSFRKITIIGHCICAASPQTGHGILVETPFFGHRYLSQKAGCGTMNTSNMEVIHYGTTLSPQEIHSRGN